MKKLLVLAAVSAMAMGAQAEYTVYIPGAQAVYCIEGSAGIDLTRDAAIAAWNTQLQPILTDAETFDSMMGPAMKQEFSSWDERYAAFDRAMAAKKFSPLDNDGNFVWDGDGHSFKNFILMALTDAEQFGPGVSYTVYYGTGDLSGGSIDIDLANPIAPLTTLPTDSPTPAPEPTSGLLLLLGVAGLALKRKRA